MAGPSTSEVFDRTPIPFGAWLGIILLFIVFGLVVLVLIGLSPRGDNYEARRAKERTEVLKKLQAEANTELHSYAWVDKSKGVARIPIDRAMELTLSDLAQKTPAPANPIESPSPAPQQPPGASPQSPATQTGAAQPSAIPTASPTPSGTPKAKAVEGKDSENRNQPAAAANPPGAQPGTQPGASVTPVATPPSQTAQPAVSPSGTPVQSPAGTPIPVPGKTP
jgi:hypothetical protein